MKKVMTTSILALLACAAAADSLKPEVLSIADFDTGAVRVMLAKTIEANGNVCQQYVSSGSMIGDGTVSIKVSKVCGKPIRKAGLHGFPDEVYPANLSAMNTVRTADGMAIQIPVIDQ